jgi:hypothetical protein
MGQAHPKPIWHLSRRDERPCALSNQELLLLAELGHLRADDLLWTPDFDGWRTVRSLLGHVTAPPLPSSISLSERPKQIGAKATLLLSRYQKKSGSRGLIESTAASRRLHGIATLNCNRLTLAGLLVAVVLVGVLGIAMHKSFATDTQPALQCAASTEPHSVATEPQSASTEPHSAATEFYDASTELYAASTELYAASTEPQQPTELATANAVNPSESSGQAESEGGIIVRKVSVFSIDMLQPSDASAFPNPVSQGPSNSVPLPTKKPARPIQSPKTAEGVPGTAIPGRMSQAPVPKPMRFGSFGFSNPEN